MSPVCPSSQCGYTLPELLIGMALSLLVVAAATSIYGTSQHTWATMAATDAVHANARVALDNIRQQAHIAGGAYLQLTPAAPTFSVLVSSNEDANHATLTGANGNKSIESVTLGHWHALDATDCQGNTGSTDTSVRNDYKLNTNKELSCKDLNLSNSTYQALAEGIEDFQLRYAQANPYAHTLQWKTADQVSDMTQVLAIEVCVRAASINTVHNIKPNEKLKGCQDEDLPTDGRVRRTFKRVISLRNREGVWP